MTSAKNIMAFLLYLMAAAVISAISVYIQYMPFSDWIFRFALITAAQLILNLWVFSFLKIKISSFIGIFTSFLYLFSFGQMAVEGLFPSYYSPIYSIRKYFDRETYIASANYSLMSVFAVVTGALIAYFIFYKRHNGDCAIIRHDADSLRYKCMGISLLVVSVPFMLNLDITKLKLSRSGGYLSSFSYNPSGFVYFLAALLLPAVFLLLIAYKDNRAKARIILIITIAYKLFAMFIGQRGQNIVFICVLIYFYYSMIEKISYKKLIFFICAAFPLLLTFRSISYMRNAPQRSFSAVLASYQKAFSHNPVVENLYEFGFTQLTVCNVHQWQPDVIAFSHGSTYFASLISILPNIGGVFDGALSIAKWTVKVDRLFGGGTGGSIIAETYYNFGNYGIIAAVIIGFFLGYFSLKLSRVIKTGQYEKAAVYSMIFFSAVWWIRDDFETMVRNTIWTAIIILILRTLFKNVETRYSRNKAC